MPHPPRSMGRPRSSLEMKINPLPHFLPMPHRPLEIHGDGLQSRDFTYVENVIEANIQAIQALTSENSGRVFNIACGEGYSILDLTTFLSRLLGKDLQLIHTEPRRGDVRDNVARIMKAEQKLGYQPKTKFLDELSKTIAYYRSHDQLAKRGDRITE